MIILDDQNEIYDYLKSLKSIEIEAEYFTKNALDGDIGVFDQFLLVHQNVYQDFGQQQKENFEKVLGAYIFSPFSPQISFQSKKILGVITPDLKNDIMINSLNFFEQMAKERLIMRSQLLTLAKHIENINMTVDKDLTKVKALHDKKSRALKSEYFYGETRYAVGESSGSEFVDLFFQEKRLIVFMFSTSSYLVSTSILKIFQEKRVDLDLDNLEETLGEIQAVYRELKRSKPDVTLSICMGAACPVKGELSLYMTGDYGAYSEAEQNIEYGKKVGIEDVDLQSVFTTLSLEKDKGIFLLSPGLVEEWAKLHGKDLLQFLNSQKTDSKDLVDELIFQLKKDLQGDFLAKDVSLLMLKGLKHVMAVV